MNWFKLPKPAHGSFSWRRLFLFVWLVFLSLLVLLLALANVGLQHQVRHLETDYYLALKEQQQLRTEWGRLMLEYSHLTARPRIQQIAETQLQLKLEKNPNLQNLQVIYLSVPAEEKNDR